MFEYLIKRLSEFDILMVNGWWFVFYKGNFLYKCIDDLDLWLFMKNKKSWIQKYKEGMRHLKKCNKHSYYIKNRKRILMQCKKRREKKRMLKKIL